MNFTVPTDAALGVALGAFIIGCFIGWMFGVEQGKRDRAVFDAIDAEYDLHEALKFAKEMRKIARASEVYEPDEEISRLTTENRRLAQKLQSRMLRRLLEKGPYPDADADENGEDKETA